VLGLPQLFDGENGCLGATGFLGSHGPWKTQGTTPELNIPQVQIAMHKKPQQLSTNVYKAAWTLFL